MATQASFGQPVVPGEAVVSNEAVMPGAVSAAPSHFTISNSYMATDILSSMSYPAGDDQTLFGFSPVSPSLPSWSAKHDPQVFTNPGLERGLKNSHVRNGQPTPPPYDDKRLNSVDQFYSLSHLQSYDGAAVYSNPTPRASFSQPAASDARQPAPRRRKTNGTHNSSSPDADDKLSEKAKREKFLERNRLAASKCRQKKKRQTEDLRELFKRLSDRKEHLTRQIDALRSEILMFKNYLLEHAQCNDEAIQLHLSTMVKNITQQDSLGASDLKTDLNALTPSSSSRTTRSQDLSFGFDSPIQIPSKMGSLEPTPRRDSEQTLASDASFSFSTPNNDGFEDLLDV